MPSDDAKSINLEHVLPENPGANWPNVTRDEALANYRRIGNLAILQAAKNSDLGNKPFPEKKPVLKASAFLWTSDIANEDDWGPTEIAKRQAAMAREATKTWPIRF